MLSYTILLYSLTGENECELCRKPCMSKHPLTHKDTIQGGEIYQMSPTSHQRVHISVLVLNRKRNAFQTHLTQC